MMNVIEVQDALKGMQMEQLIREVQMPSGQVPQFLVLSEITRRREMEKAYAQNQGQPQTTVAQDAVAASGVPQAGIAGISRAMAPNTDMAQNTGAAPQAPVQQMASGGYVQKMQAGGRLSTPPIQFMTDPSVREMASRQGMSVEEFWSALSDEAKERQLRTYADTQGAADDGTLSRISDLPAAAQPQTFSAPAMFGGFSIPPESVPQRPVLGIQGYAREPRAYDPRGMGMGLDALSNIQNMAPNTVEGRQADYAARMAGEGAVAARRQENETQARSSIVDAMRRDALGERALAGRVGMDTSGIDAPSVYDRPMTAAEILAASAGPSAALPAPPPDEAAPVATSPVAPEAYDDGYQAAAEAMSGLTPEQLSALKEIPPEVEVLEGGTTPAGGPPVSPPLPPGRGVIPPTTPPAPPAGGGAGIAGAMSPLEGEIASLLQQREKRAEQDKWLALAQAGMALMSSRQPTFAGALGEAGLTGLEQFRKSRDQYEEDRLGLMTAQERLRAARVAAGARGAAKERGAPKLGDISAYYGKRAEMIKAMSDPLTDDATKELIRRELLALERSFLAATSAPFDATAGEEG